MPGTPTFKRDAGDKNDKESKANTQSGLFSGNFNSKEQKNEVENTSKGNLFSNLTAATQDDK